MLEQLNDFQIFTDNYLNKRAIQLQQIYGDDLQAKKEMFTDCLLKLARKELKVLSFEGREISQAEQVELQKEVVMEPEVSQVYASIVEHENFFRLQKWAQKLVKDHFEELDQIHQHSRREESKESQASMIGYIGSTIGWLSSGAASYGASYLGASTPSLEQPQATTPPVVDEPRPAEVEDDSDDEFLDALDEDLTTSAERLQEEGSELTQQLVQEGPSAAGAQMNQNDIERMSMQLYNDFTSSQNMLNNFRKHKNKLQ